jgi:RNA polymerase sigma-70 factor (ECF subfamily)
MGGVVGDLDHDQAPLRQDLVGLYDHALPEVYGYLSSRCRSDASAEELTSETFMAAVDAVRRGTVAELSVAWLIGVARHKLVDYWRRRERESRTLRALGDPVSQSDDEWDVLIDALLAHEILGELGYQHRSALTLRYLDGLPVREVAMYLDRSVGATEALLVRAKAAFRTQYEARSRESGEELR